MDGWNGKGEAARGAGDKGKGTKLAEVFRGARLYIAAGVAGSPLPRPGGPRGSRPFLVRRKKKFIEILLI